MDLLTNLIIDMEVLDKRETGGASTNMEREGSTHILLRLMKQIDIEEIATDASSSLMRRISDLKGIISNTLIFSKCHSKDFHLISLHFTQSFIKIYFDSSAEPKQYLKKDSAVMEKLRSVVLDAKILNKLKYYTKFRHTGFIENFNSMLKS
ncbi:uncharacterized protein LOC135683869 [Rhopilema esculentum]|uniref:uncharacterized protein LOC135683869 n=1 Tax=Rhopilema esculentum TaxID=499914 RepID=UPI0031E12FC0